MSTYHTNVAFGFLLVGRTEAVTPNRGPAYQAYEIQGTPQASHGASVSSPGSRTGMRGHTVKPLWKQEAIVSDQCCWERDPARLPAHTTLSQ